MTMHFREPVVGIAYGASKLGKTTDLIYTFSNRGYYIAVPAALKPSEGVVGITLNERAIYNAATIEDATKKVQEIGKLRGSDGRNPFDAVVVDDFSLLADQTFSVLERKHSGYRLFGALRDDVLEFRAACRAAGLHVFVNAHETSPSNKNGAYVRGGPKLPGRLPEDLPAAFDVVLRASGSPGRNGWPVVYKCDPNDNTFISGDRHGVTPPECPINIGEILRAAGYSVRRAAGMEWLDGAADYLATELKARPSEEKTILAAFTDYILTNKYPRVKSGEATDDERRRALLHVRWAIRDGRDRAYIRAAMANPLSIYGVNL